MYKTEEYAISRDKKRMRYGDTPVMYGKQAKQANNKLASYAIELLAKQYADKYERDPEQVMQAIERAYALITYSFDYYSVRGVLESFAYNIIHRPDEVIAICEIIYPGYSDDWKKRDSQCTHMELSYKTIDKLRKELLRAMATGHSKTDLNLLVEAQREVDNPTGKLSEREITQIVSRY